MCTKDATYVVPKLITLGKPCKTPYSLINLTLEHQTQFKIVLKKINQNLIRFGLLMWLLLR